jgi:hypothetical protein
MHDKSWMTALPTNNFEVRSLLYQHNERVVLRRGRNNITNNNAYNPEFGGGSSTCKFVGTGLSSFKTQEKAKVYTGAVYVNVNSSSSSQQPSPPTNNENTRKSVSIKTVTIADRSGSFQAMATKKVRHELPNLLLHSTTALDSTNRRFLVTIRMILLDDDDNNQRKHFVLTNLAPMDSDA